MIDFKKATLADSPRQFILRELLKIIEADEEFSLGDWHKSIRPAYAHKIDSLRRGALYLLSKNDPASFDTAIAHEINRDREAVEPFVEAILSNATTKIPGFLVIDNVDQLDEEAQQESIFIEAQALARKTGLNVIMSLRESTYLRHRDKPVFDAFQVEAFYVDPPNVLPVLSHRFNFAKKLLEAHSVKLTTEHGLTVRVPDLSVFFDIVSRSILDDETGLLIESLSGGNIRRGLAIVREFLASGHTNADHAIATYLTSGSYHFPKHEFFRGAILGSFRYFNDSFSLLPNLFDAKLASSTLQLLRLHIVAHLVDRATQGLTEGVPVAELAAACSRVGVPERDFLAVIQDLGKREMCRSVDGLALEIDSSIVPTRLAAYALKQMCRDFAYADFCCVDASILDADSLAAMQDVTSEIEATKAPPERVALRLKRMELFLDYLIRCEERWIVECRRRDLAAFWHQQLVQGELKPAVLKDGAAALRAAERRYGKTQEQPKVADRRTRVTDPATYSGTITHTWPDKEYVFLKDTKGIEWFSHRRDFLSDADWLGRRRNARCGFMRGDWEGKPRATSVRLLKSGRANR